MKKLTIEHNHGVLVLADVTLDEEGVATGTVISGHVTSRLFTATHTRHEEPGQVKQYPLYGRKPYETAPGEYRVSCCFCG